jgi:hypothetical protein
MVRTLLLLAAACGHSDPGLSADAPVTADAPPDALTSYHAAVIADSPALYLRLGESGGATVHDEIGGMDGTIAGSCTFNVVGAIAGDPDGALQFDGTTCKITLPADGFAFPGTASFTVESWVSTSMDASFHHVFSKETRDAQNPIDGYGVLVSPTGFTFERVVATMGNLKTPAYLVSPGFHHFVAVYTGSEMRIYVDGSLAGTLPDTRSMNAIAAPPIIGGSTVGNFYKGVIDELAVYPVALSAARIALHHRLGVGAPP